MKKKIMKIIGITTLAIFLLLCIGAIALSIFTGKQVAEGLVFFNKGNDTKANSVNQLNEWGYDLAQFEKTYTPAALEIEAADGNKIPAFLFSKETNTDTVILVHGFGGDHVSVYPVAQMYLENDWNVITFDARGAGDSTDEKTSFGYYEIEDIRALASYAASTLHSERIIVHGQSMGAAATGLFASSEYASLVDAVIMDSPFESMEKMFLGVWHEMEGTEDIPDDYVIACGDWYLKHFYGFSFKDTDVMEKMKENETKTLIIGSTQDNLISVDKTTEMFHNIKSEKKEICYFDCPHIKGIYDFPSEYADAVFSFINN